MPVKAACVVPFQCVLITEWQVKKPHTVVGILIPVSLSHGKQFQMGPALCCYNTASALWHGKSALSPSSNQRAIEGRPGLQWKTEALTVTQAGGWWANARRLLHWVDSTVWNIGEEDSSWVTSQSVQNVRTGQNAYASVWWDLVSHLSAAAQWLWMLQWALEPGQLGTRHCADAHRRCLIP